MGDISLRGQGRALLKKGGYVDMSEEHEGMESKAEEAKEYAMEDKGYKETKSGKMVKAAKGGQTKVGKVMRDFKSGKLHSGKKGPVVKSRKQALQLLFQKQESLRKNNG
jgi:hypothetical protein